MSLVKMYIQMMMFRKKQLQNQLVSTVHNVFFLKPCSLQSLEVPSIIKHCEFAAIILSSARLKQRVVSLRNSRSSISLSGARARVRAPVSRGMHLSVQGWFRQGFFLWPLWCPSDPPCPAHCFTTGRWLVEKKNVVQMWVLPEIGGEFKPLIDEFWDLEECATSAISRQTWSQSWISGFIAAADQFPRGYLPHLSGRKVIVFHYCMFVRVSLDELLDSSMILTRSLHWSLTSRWCLDLYKKYQ